MSDDYVLPLMESFGALTGDERDSILLQALQHTGGQFGVMQEELGNLHGENCLLCKDNTHSQQLLRNALVALGRASTGGPRETKQVKTARVAAPTPFKGDSELVDSYLAECWLHFRDNPTYKRQREDCLHPVLHEGRIGSGMGQQHCAGHAQPEGPRCIGVTRSLRRTSLMPLKEGHRWKLRWLKLRSCARVRERPQSTSLS
jgi:hypothetical protein